MKFEKLLLGKTRGQGYGHRVVWVGEGRHGTVNPDVEGRNQGVWQYSSRRWRPAMEKRDGVSTLIERCKKDWHDEQDGGPSSHVLCDLPSGRAGSNCTRGADAEAAL